MLIEKEQVEEKTPLGFIKSQKFSNTNKNNNH